MAVGEKRDVGTKKKEGEEKQSALMSKGLVEAKCLENEHSHVCVTKPLNTHTQMYAHTCTQKSMAALTKGVCVLDFHPVSLLLTSNVEISSAR